MGEGVGRGERGRRRPDIEEGGMGKGGEGEIERRGRGKGRDGREIEMGRRG